jgi:hypothetical protein
MASRLPFFVERLQELSVMQSIAWNASDDRR